MAWESLTFVRSMFKAFAMPIIGNEQRRKPPGGEGEMFILRRRLQAFVIYVQNFANFDLSE